MVICNNEFEADLISIERPDQLIVVNIPERSYSSAKAKFSKRLSSCDNKCNMIKMDANDPYYHMVFLHELSHIILINHYNIEEWDNTLLPYITTSKRVVHEYLAWALAKGMCKPELWNEKEALRCLHTYTDICVNSLKQEINSIDETDSIYAVYKEFDELHNIIFSKEGND